MAKRRPFYPTRNPIYLKLESKDHPIVRGLYALHTAPIDELFHELCLWINHQVSGGLVYGPSDFGKSIALRFWIIPLLAESYHGKLPLVVLTCKDHERLSESMFLMELLGGAGHRTEERTSKKSMLKLLAELYAARARNVGSNQIVLIIDECQTLHDSHYKTVFDLQCELDNLGFRLTVIFIGSRESEERQELGVRSHGLDSAAQLAVRSARFRGIRSAEELKRVLGDYDSRLAWPEASGICFTQYFFPRAFADGFRMANCASTMWCGFEDLVWDKRSYPLEIPMEFVANTVESVFRDITDDEIRSGMSPCSNDVVQGVITFAPPNYKQATARLLLIFASYETYLSSLHRLSQHVLLPGRRY